VQNAKKLEMSQKIQKFWDKQAKRYDHGERQFASVYKDIIAKTCKYLLINDNALDYGCATGTKTIELAHKVQHIHGLDISTEMINIAIKKKDESELSNISFSQGTIFSSNLEKTSFDKIVAYGIIQLLENNEKVIQRIHELLKPGGLFISTTACMKDKMAIKTRIKVTTYLFMKKLGIFPLHLNMFTAADVEKLIKDKNFQIVEAEKITYGIPALFIVARK
jgi:ubiquinone/menaquinone biosynthesis C-methylase UbiE